MSCLSLSDGELKIGYTRYLLIKEICPTEIALLIHSLEIQHRRKAAYACFFSLGLTGINEERKALLLLDSLEDRFVNPVVIAMRAQLAHLNLVSDMVYYRIRHEEMIKARDLLYSRKEEELSDIELYFKAFVLETEFISPDCAWEKFEILRMYEMSVANTFLPSFIRLARLLCSSFYDIRDTITTTFEDVMEKGIALGCYSCIEFQADYLYARFDFDGRKKSNIKAAKLGVSLAIGRCLIHEWDYK